MKYPVIKVHKPLTASNSGISILVRVFRVFSLFFCLIVSRVASIILVFCSLSHE